jgi:hypothetical protein
MTKKFIGGLKGFKFIGGGQNTIYEFSSGFFLDFNETTLLKTVVNWFHNFKLLQNIHFHFQKIDIWAKKREFL